MVQPVAVAGATGAVGQQLIAELTKSSQFYIAQLLASSRHQRRTLQECARPWMADGMPSQNIAQMPVEPIEDGLRPRIVFSALPSEIASVYEKKWQQDGHLVFSLASAHRMEQRTPTVVVDINPCHLEKSIQDARQGRGVIICKPNCVVAILATVLKPLLEIGLVSVDAVSLQSLSGAGYPGPSAWQMCADLLPWIEGEESKIEAEVPKILGSYNASEQCFVARNDLNIIVSCIRVPVARGHSLQLTLEFRCELDTADIFDSLSKVQSLQYQEDPAALTPNRTISLRNPMTVYWGRLRKVRSRVFKLWAVGDNLGRGASVGALALADYFCKRL